MTISGRATIKGTQRYADRHQQLSYRPLGMAKCLVSEVGFGSYRLNLGNGSHEQALRFALETGINLIDTSANYADGGSERLIGRVLTELIDSQQIERDEVVVVSKAGYLQGFNYALAQQRKQEGRPFPNLIKYADGLDHCIHPEFLEDQLTRSLRRLNLETLDGYLLHNPEYYLMWAQKAHYQREAAWEEYYRRIRQALAYLEQEVANGRIQWFGISSNTFPEPAGHFSHTSLAKTWEIAASLEGKHHFFLVQTPLNLLETGAAIEENQPNQLTFLQFAQQKDLAVLINRPLNAFNNNSLTRLAQVDMPNYPAPPEDVSTAVDSLVNLENHFQQEILPELGLTEGNKKLLLEQLALGRMLDGRWGGFGTYQNWRDLQAHFLLPRVQEGVETLSNRENLPAEANFWLDEYIAAANVMLAALGAYYQEMAARRCEQMMETVAAINPAWVAQTLSQTAVRALRATSGVTIVLVGMRQQAYVQDMLLDLENPIERGAATEEWQALSRQINP